MAFLSKYPSLHKYPPFTPTKKNPSIHSRKWKADKLKTGISSYPAAAAGRGGIAEITSSQTVVSSSSVVYDYIEQECDDAEDDATNDAAYNKMTRI